MVKFLDSDLNDAILAEVVKDDLKRQLLADSLKNLIEALCGNEHLLTTYHNILPLQIVFSIVLQKDARSNA